jgi:hypothetical protein
LATRLEPAAAASIIELAGGIGDLDAAGVGELMRLAGCFA